MYGVLPEPYFTHYSLLVVAVHIILGDSITTPMIEKAEKYLYRFYEMFSTLYGNLKPKCKLKFYNVLLNFTDENGCTMNVHMVRHITECVRNWGPMWAYSCFSFESMNGQLRRLHHGTRNMNVNVSLLFYLSNEFLLHNNIITAGFHIYLVATSTCRQRPCAR